MRICKNLYAALKRAEFASINIYSIVIFFDEKAIIFDVNFNSIRVSAKASNIRVVGPTRASRCPGIGHHHAAGAFMWHRRIYYHLAVHANRAGLPPVNLVSEDGTVKALVLLLAFAATLLAGSERIYVANTGGADISVIDSHELGDRRDQGFETPACHLRLPGQEPPLRPERAGGRPGCGGPRDLEGHPPRAPGPPAEQPGDHTRLPGIPQRAHRPSGTR
jgi:hypothetical protein